MKKLTIALFVSLVGFTSVAHGSDATLNTDDRLNQLCDNRGVTNILACKQIISEELDNSYRKGESLAHLPKKQKLAKQTEYIASEEIAGLCLVAPDKVRCETYKGFLVEEFNAGIGLY